jgi:EAL domain-containing protein (putative c-di-GMP-specific phosphodiesterase class I)
LTDVGTFAPRNELIGAIILPTDCPDNSGGSKLALGIPAFSIAFQPIVDIAMQRTVSFEALVRGKERQGAAWVLDQISTDNQAAFDTQCRETAIRLAASLGLKCQINVNCLPSSLVDIGSAIERTRAVAATSGLKLSAIVLEITEHEIIADRSKFAQAIHEFRRAGVKIAIDDFGAGYSGLNLLAELQPDVLKLDMYLIRDIQEHGPRQAIVRGILHTCGDLGIDVIAEGVETIEEFRWCAGAGITLFQGYLFAKPAFESLPIASIPTLQRLDRHQPRRKPAA